MAPEAQKRKLAGVLEPTREWANGAASDFSRKAAKKPSLEPCDAPMPTSNIFAKSEASAAMRASSHGRGESVDGSSSSLEAQLLAAIDSVKQKGTSTKLVVGDWTVEWSQKYPGRKGSLYLSHPQLLGKVRSIKELRRLFQEGPVADADAASADTESSDLQKQSDVDMVATQSSAPS
eukprot:3166775-Prymnesium_polylepis.1